MILDYWLNVINDLLADVIAVLPSTHFFPATAPDFGSNSFFDGASDLLNALDWILPVREVLTMANIGLLVLALWFTIWIAGYVLEKFKP